MRSRTSVKPSDYPPLPFHGIRSIIFLSSLVVAIILAIFIYHLRADGFKLPYVYLVLLLSSVLSLITITTTALVNCTCRLSPKLSLFTNILPLIIWLVALGLLAYSMSGTILTACTTEYWATATGISVCRTYKALFAFTVLSTLGHLLAIVLDVVVRRRQTRLGAYDPMASTAALGEDPWDVKLAERRDSVAGRGGGGAHYDDVPTGAGAGAGAPGVRFQSGYQHPAERTGYDPAAYR
ncbi:Uncharacterized protein PECH_004166 [Penicillium ucsense]|uniref:MARVEL domain-containing protein n=1 Tax=Penicillium ucsense TaxID=2839758 RepID=A0A8J8WK07_9EURO|nr:Uncharacterized protein PECM_005573 [Penicillium ucsense]KAF7737248.1 Uncharacterized protein PECH_004166 [Penicillium ucsense]